MATAGSRNIHPTTRMRPFHQRESENNWEPLLDDSAWNCYQKQLDSLYAQGVSAPACAAHLTEAYLDDKPRQQGKRKISQRERDRQFWSLVFWRVCSPEIWDTHNFELALTRYMGQEAVAAPDLFNLISQSKPEVVHRAARHSRLVLNPTSPRRTELEAAASLSPVIHELCQVFLVFEKEHIERQGLLRYLQTTFDDASPFDLLFLSSLYAFKRLIPKSLGVPGAEGSHSDQVVWDAVNDLLIWKLRTCPEAALRLDDQKIGSSLAAYMRPLLFGDAGEEEALHEFSRFESLMVAQIKLNEFESRSADAFSYDDGIQFVREGTRLEIQEITAAARRKWETDGHKLELLHGYWFYRALDEFAQSEDAGLQIGTAENHEANQLAFISALRAKLQLREVYGVSEQTTLDSGTKVPVFQTMLGLELMSAHFLKDHLVRYTTLLAAKGDWRLALRALAFEGLLNGMQIRLPLTWSDRDAKIKHITGWTVSPDLPAGSARTASAILDFWSFDMQEVATRLRADQSGPKPTLNERPVLKFSSTYVQLPWIVGLQNRSTAVINNLRRLGADRVERKVETQVIEENLASLLRSRGFCVVLNWNPPEPWRDAGEVDVIAARDGHLFVLEVKSTFVRRSMRDAWLHATSTLRKAGRQVEKKLQAVCAAMESSLLTEQLGMDMPAITSQIHGWIVDTSIECDHELFHGYLKVSLEEVLIALRDDAQLRSDSDGLLGNTPSGTDGSRGTSTLYPEGFSAGRFVEIIQSAAVWEQLTKEPD